MDALSDAPAGARLGTADREHRRRAALAQSRRAPRPRLPPPRATCNPHRSSYRLPSRLVADKALTLRLPSPLAGNIGPLCCSSRHLQETEVFREPRKSVFLKYRGSKARGRPLWPASGEGRRSEDLCTLQVGSGASRHTCADSKGQLPERDGPRLRRLVFGARPLPSLLGDHLGRRLSRQRRVG
jgi:hypothetical protein